MNNKLISEIRYVVNIIGPYLPKGKFRELLRKCYHRSYLHPFYSLKKIIRETELLEDNILFVELNNGIKFYGPCENNLKPPIKYLSPQKPDRLEELDMFSFLVIIYDQYVENVYEKHYKIKKGDIIVDAGAHIGISTVKMAKVVGDKGKVFAIEPEANNLRFLQRNIRVNELNNVTIVPKGLWSTKGRMKLNLSLITIAHSFYLPSETNDNNRFEEVEVDTLDNILKGVEKVNFIRINIEGAEIEALKGGKDILRKHNINLAIDAHHIVNGKRTSEIIIPQLKLMGYKIWTRKGILYGKNYE